MHIFSNWMQKFVGTLLRAQARLLRFKKTLKVVFLSAEVGVNAATWYIFQTQAKNQEFFAEKKFHIFSHLEKNIIFQDKGQLSLFTQSVKNSLKLGQK